MSRKTSTSSEWSSHTSVASSSPEPTVPQLNLIAQIKYILELEGFPADYDWSDVDLFWKAMSYGRQHLIKLFLEKGCRAIKHCTTNPTLHEHLCKISWPNVLEQLVNLGASVNNRNCRGDTAVHLAFMHDATDGVFDSLLENYLNQTKENLTNSDGLNFLHIACAKSSLQTVWKLIERFPKDVNRQVALKTRTTFSGYTPLHFAVLYSRYDIAQLLLMNKANFCARDSNFSTPLHLALYGEDADMIDLILAYDRKWENCVNKFGLNHLMAACVGSRVSVVEKFLHVAETECKLPPSSMVKFSVIRSLKYPFAGYTPLHFAAKNGNFETTKLLLNHGASTYALTSSDFTPLALARIEGHEQVCRLLQQYSNKRLTESIIVKKMESLKINATPCNFESIINPIIGIKID